MALNDRRVSRTYQMWNSWRIPSSETREHIISWVATVAGGASGGKLKNVVLNCHGNPAYLQLGAGFDRTHTRLFLPWAGLVDKIWITACRAGFIQTPGAAATGDGNLFCSEIARAAGCYVVASTETQWFASGHVYPFGQIDSFEGLVLSYGPGGDVTWSHRYPSGWSGE